MNTTARTLLAARTRVAVIPVQLGPFEAVGDTRIDSIRALQADPIAQQQWVTQMTRGFGDSHPGMVVAAAQQLAKAMALLAPKMAAPAQAEPSSAAAHQDLHQRRRNPLNGALRDGHREADERHRGLEAQRCLLRLCGGAQGGLPRHLPEWSHTVQAELSKTTKPLSYNEQLQTSILLALPGNYFQQSGFFARNAEMYAKANQAAKGKGKPSQAPPAQRKAVEAGMTQSQRLETRL